MVPFVLRLGKPYPQFLWLTLGITSVAARRWQYIYGWPENAQAVLCVKLCRNRMPVVSVDPFVLSAVRRA